MGLLSFVIVITQLEHLREISIPVLLIECYGSKTRWQKAGVIAQTIDSD
jgi:hypothetical protein